MAIDREKVLATAQKFVERRKYDKAVFEYQKIIGEDPNDARILLKIGDLQSKMESYADAIATYERVGRHYASQGFALKAIAVYKQIRELITKHTPGLEVQYAHITPKLAELYQQLGLTSDALAALDEVATRLQRQQRDAEAIEVFRKIVELDPTNPLPHLRLAEAFSRAQNVDAAVSEFATAASQLLKLGRRDDALKVLERLLHHKADPMHARMAAELYLSRGQQTDGMQALAKLQLCFQANPQDLDTLNLLARAFNIIGQAAKAIEVQKEMARIARATGKTDIFVPLVQHLLLAAPNDEGVQKLAAAAGLGAPAPTPPPVDAPHPGYARPQPPATRPGSGAGTPYAPAPPTAVTGAQIDELSYEPVDTHDLIAEPSSFDREAQQFLRTAPPEDEVVPVERAHVARGASPATRESYASLVDDGQLEIVEPGESDGEIAPDVSEELTQILADAGSFRRVRLYSKAITTLRQGVELEPRSLDVREALRDVLLEAGRTAEAVDEMLAMGSLYIDALDGETAARMLQDALNFDPGNARAIEMLRELGYEYADDEATSDGYPDAEGTERFAHPNETPLPSYDLEEMGPADTSDQYPDQRVIMSPQARAATPLPSFPLDAPEPESNQPFDLVQPTEAYGAGDAHLPPQPYAEDDDTVPPPGAVVQGDLEEALEEAEFFLSRGLFEDARSILGDQLQLHPKNRLLREKLAELEQQEQNTKRGSGTRERPLDEPHPGIEPDARPRAPSREVDRSFDIAASLDAIEETNVPVFGPGDKQVDVEDVFAKFKEGVAQQISIDDGQSHYDLGVAYKEMGLVDDAIRELETAARDPKRECVCRSMIGMIQMERGNSNEAIDAFMRGLHAQQKSPEQETVLCFEIGNAYEIKKMNREALSYYQKVMRREPNYRDVQERVRRLSTYASKSPPRAAAVGADDEFDRAFEDLIGKD